MTLAAPMPIINPSIVDNVTVIDRQARIDWLQLISAEYRELPDLCLTKRQVRRLWNLDVITSEAVLETLETSGFLRRTRSGAYVRARA